MAAKTIKVSDDSGSNYYTLPGNTGEFSDQLGVVDDTIFGQTFRSQQPNIINWSVSANALYKGFAGYVVDIKKSGSTTAMTGEAMTLVSGKTYKITNATKNVWNRNVAVTVYDNAVDHTADVVAIDYLFGTVTFDSGYTVTGPVTVDGSYLPMAALAKYQNFSLTQSMEAINDSDIPTLQANSGHATFSHGLRTVNLEVSGVYASTNGYRAALIARDELVLEVNPDGGSKTVARGFFRPSTRTQQGAVGALEEETASFVLTVPEGDFAPFKWDFASNTDVSTAVRKCLEAFQNETTLDIQYLPDGTTGLEGEALVTDFSLSGGMEAMNEFAVTFQGTGQVSTV